MKGTQRNWRRQVVFGRGTVVKKLYTWNSAKSIYVNYSALISNKNFLKRLKIASAQLENIYTSTLCGFKQFCVEAVKARSVRSHIFWSYSLLPLFILVCLR